MSRIKCVTEIDRVSTELANAGYYLKELRHTPLPPNVEGKFSKFVEMDILLRAVATCEIDASYALAPLSRFDEKLYFNALHGRSGEECLSVYLLWQFIDGIAEGLKSAKGIKHAKGLMIYLAWFHLRPLLHSLALFTNFYKALEKINEPESDEERYQLTKAPLWSYELVYGFYTSKERKVTISNFLAKSRLERDFLRFVLCHEKDLSRVRTILDAFVRGIIVR